MSNVEQWEQLFNAVISVFQVMWKMFWVLLAQSYFERPYFIVRIILIILNVGFGIWLGKSDSKKLCAYPIT